MKDETPIPSYSSVIGDGAGVGEVVAAGIC